MLQRSSLHSLHYTIAVVIRHRVYSDTCLLLKDVIKNVNYSTIKNIALTNL